MAGEVLVLNPRRKRRKARTTTKRRRHRAHHRRVNPRRRRSPLMHRRRRAYARRRHNPRRRRHYRRNPGMRMFGIDFGQVAMVAGGGIVTEVLADKLAAVLPATWKTNADVVRIGTKAVVGVGLPMLAGKFLPRGWGAAIALGGGIVTVLDIFKTYVAPKLGITLSSYEIGPWSGMADYEVLPGMSGLTADGNISGGAYAGSVYGS